MINYLLIGCAWAEVYEISEPDLLQEIYQNKDKLIEKLPKLMKKAEDSLYSKKGVYLPPSKKNYTYYVDPTFTLQTDIPIVDKQGKVIGILYRKGTKFNPLNYIQIKPPPMIIFNACSDRQVFLVKKLMKDKNRLSYILVSGGCSIKQIKEKNVYKLLNERIYLLTDELVKKLKLKNAISFVDVDLKKKRIKVEIYKVTTD